MGDREKGPLESVIAAAVDAQRDGTQVVWRTTSAVHPLVARMQGRLLPKHAFFTQPRIDEINRLTVMQLQGAGLDTIDVSAMTRLRPDMHLLGDMRHYDDRMNAEMTELLASVICPDASFHNDD